MSDNNDLWDDDEVAGAKVSDLVRDGDLAPIVNMLVEPIERQRDAYREVAVQATVENKLLKAAKDDVDAESDRRLGRNHLRAVD